MTWIKLNDNVPRHPKVAGLSDRAFRAWINSLCYASEFLTDGLLPMAFLVTVPPKVQDEIIAAGLWMAGPPVNIHDYLAYQTSRESVERERARNRNRRKGDRWDNSRITSGTTTGRTGGTTAGRTGEVPRPENRDQIQRSENTEQRQQQAAAPASLVTSYVVNRRNQCAFVGGRLEVPHVLHDELRKLLGGANADADLASWYAAVDADIAKSGEAIVPNVYKWLKARYATWKPAAMNGKSINAEIDEWAKS